MLDPGVTRVDLTAERIVCVTIHPRTTERVTNNFGCTFAAIGHRHHVDLCVRQNIAQTSCDIFRDFARAERALELIRRNKDFHDILSKVL